MTDLKFVKLLDPTAIVTGGLVPKGVYSGATSYSIGDSVSYNGSSYVAIASTTGNLPTDTTKWMLLASQGAAGTPGAAGTNGSNGTNGTNGAAATISVGTVTTGAAGSAVAITNAGSSSAAVFNFSIPKGDTGASGGIVRTVSTLTTSATIGNTTNTDYVTFVDVGGVPTLPTAVGNTSRYTIKNISSSNKTLSTTSSQTIDGSTTATLTPNTSLDVVSDGANWRII